MTQDAALAVRNAQDFAAAFNVSREALGRLELYEQLLRQWQKAVNLVAPSTLDDIWHRHFADSAQLLALAPAARTWTDLGSGAGFPGLVIAMLLAETDAVIVPSPIVPEARLRHDAGEGPGGGDSRTSTAGIPPTPNPSPQGGGESARHEIRCVTLIESNARKAAFLREVVRQTGIGDRIAVDILSTRIETAATQASLPRQDVVSARALAPLDQLLTLAAPLFAPATVGLFMKGREAAQEIETARKTWNFNVELIPSRTDPGARIVVVRQPRPQDPKNEGK